MTAQDSAPSQGAGKDDLVKALELAKVTLDELFAVAGDTAYPHRNAKKWDELCAAYDAIGDVLSAEVSR